MGQGAFNVSRLIAELGLQQIKGDEMRVLESIQPVMSVGDLSDITPPHVAPSAYFGGFMSGNVGTAGTISVQSMALGGTFLEWLTFESGTTAANFRTQAADPGLGVLETPAGVASRDATQAIVRSGDIALIAGFGAIVGVDALFLNFSQRAIFIPRGQFLVFQLNATGAGNFAFWGIGLREVPASEHVPS